MLFLNAFVHLLDFLFALIYQKFSYLWCIIYLSSFVYSLLLLLKFLLFKVIYQAFYLHFYSGAFWFALLLLISFSFTLSLCLWSFLVTKSLTKFRIYFFYYLLRLTKPFVSVFFYEQYLYLHYSFEYLAFYFFTRSSAWLQLFLILRSIDPTSGIRWLDLSLFHIILSISLLILFSYTLKISLSLWSLFYFSLISFRFFPTLFFLSYFFFFYSFLFLEFLSCVQKVLLGSIDQIKTATMNKMGLHH